MQRARSVSTGTFVGRIRKAKTVYVVGLLALCVGCSSDNSPSQIQDVDVALDDGSTDSSAADTSSIDVSDMERDAEDLGNVAAVRGAPISNTTPACGSNSELPATLIPSNGDGFEPDLENDAVDRDRQFHAINAWKTGGNSDLRIAPTNTVERQAIVDFIATDAWDFEATTGLAVESVIDRFGKVTGAYAGVGIAADSFRYAVLRDSGAACEDVDRARAHVVNGLELLHNATRITGVSGVIARALARTDIPGDGERQTTPLFDGNGNPLPEEKNNGTWRADESGELSDWIWEDSCSRDQLVGWVLGMTTIWEVVRDDPSIDQALKTRLQNDATAIAKTLMIVGEDGYDLEIQDADGRLTFHAYLNEHAIDRIYAPTLENGQHAIMALGIVSGLAEISDDPEVDQFLATLIGPDRRLDEIAANSAGLIALGDVTNFSNYNMAYTGAWLAGRYIHEDDARRHVRTATIDQLYNQPDKMRQPVEQSWSFYDLVYVANRAFMESGYTLTEDVDEDALERGLVSLRDFPKAPFFAVPIENCDEDEIAARDCVAVDGTPIPVQGRIGRNNELISSEPVPMKTRAANNFYWRQNPYGGINGTDDSGLFPANDFRFVYWAGRYLRRAL